MPTLSVYRDKLFPHTTTLWTPNRYGRFLQEEKVPPWYNNSQEQTVREYYWRFKFSLEPYREGSQGQRLIWYLAFPPVTVLMRITVTLYQIVPRHLILQRIVLLIFPKSEPGQLQTIYATAWKIKKDIIWEIVIRGNAHATVHLRTINQFLKLVHLRK